MTSRDMLEIRRFERLLRIWGRIDREEREPVRKMRRRRAACRLVYGSDVNSWPSFRETPMPVAGDKGTDSNVLPFERRARRNGEFP